MISGRFTLSFFGVVYVAFNPCWLRLSAVFDAKYVVIRALNGLLLSLKLDLSGYLCRTAH
ncbi:hypothetical protein Rahaq2_4543 [Rahnella aquatilis CIP 78.65 = ATCC 33071]|uniref:Uncharacterized protein n=1 Tax=Rahnella aquatilis (strain ATCC 33071 / DSM 4594 / JCM 1683 / NBRC 105701 / NCIMB 13365 / CIP 78.65) TaxID=745277 RepID=H2IZ11_RAHAC|nr:hypothetical protein Rahaq2_4543 [Rahnella aquatilis CIP 78.65 = ATCC 33071]